MPKINVDSLFICPITGCLIEDPVSIDGDTTGQLYERKAIEYYFQNHDTLPHTQTLAKTKKLKTNHAARTAIKEILKKHHPCTLATFFEAVMSGQMETLHKINYLSSYCRAKNINHLTALQLATTKGFEAIVETLIADSDINACTPDGTTPLHIAANKGFLGIVEQLISAGAKLDAPDNLGRTPLHAAVLGEQDTVTQKLIAAGAPLEAKDTGGSTALHFTAAKCNVKVAAWLLEAGANLEAKTEAGTTPLFDAITWYSNALLSFLLKKGADITVKDNNKGLMPLHLAAMCGNDFAVEQLLVKGADCNAKDKYDNTPLHLAASKGGAKVTQLLLSVGAEPFAKNHFQLTPSDYAKNMDYQNLVKKQQTILEQGLKRAPFTIRVLQQTIEQQAMQLGQQEQRLAQQQQEMQQLKTQMSDLMILINQTKMSYEKKSNKHYKLTLFPK